MEIDYKSVADAAMTYQDYREACGLLAERHETSGLDQTEEQKSFTRLNQSRMNKWDKIAKVDDETIQRVKGLRCKYTWLVLAEAWCGDVAQNLPFAAKLADSTDLIDLKVIWRDENPNIMDRFLENGSRSIPRIIALDDQWKVRGDWGSRPGPAKAILARHKTGSEWDKHAFHKELHLWYAKDKGHTVMNELLDLVDKCI